MFFSSLFSIDGRCEVEGSLWVVSGRSRGLCGRSWAALGAYVGGLGRLLGLMLATLGRCWGLCWRFWAALGAFVGGLGSSSGQKWPKPERKVIWQADQGPKVAHTRARRPFWGGNCFTMFSGPPGARTLFFLIDVRASVNC